MAWTVYRHITPSGKSYIGITSKKPEDRWKNGRGYRENTPFGKAIEKYKWENIKHEILDTNLEEVEAKRLENEYIEKYRTYIYLQDCNGYNCTLGGEGSLGYIASEEARKKISESNKGRTVWNKGKKGKQHHSEEARKKISESNKGRTVWNKGKPSPNKGKHLSEEQKKKISASLKGQIPWNRGKTGVQLAHNKGKHLVIIDGKRHYE